METLEFIIHPDGRIEERVTGITGSSCATVTAAIEAQLGVLTSRELTAEHFVRNDLPVQVENSLSSWSL